MRMFFENMGHQGLMLTYDDVRLRTIHSDVLPTQTDISSRLTSNILLKMPIVSSPMDTVTTGPMAVAMAENGGAGSIYRMKDVHEQARHVRRAKFSLNGLIQTPITVQHDEIIADVVKIREQKGYKFETFPVLDESGKVCGLVSGSDFDFCENHNAQMSSIMTDVNLLVSAPSNTTKREAYEIMRKNKKKVLLLIDDGELRGMYIYSDLVRTFANGGAMYNVDKNGQLIVGAAVGAGPAAIERATALAEKNVDYFQIDTAHGDSGNVIWTIKELKRLFPHIDVLAGNVSSGRGAVALAKAGADGILVGQGPGSICTTRVIAGVGVPQVSAIYECVTALELAGYGHVPVCADGGINNSGDIVIALAVGASSVMLGRLLAGTEESPGETRLYNGAQVKDYRGMGSFGAMRDNAASRERYGQAAVSLNKVVPEGIEGIVPFRGPVAGVLNHHTGGLRSGLGYNGCRTIQELQAHAEIFRITNAGLSESHPHDITITAEAPNYHR
jgi:IMP dehydrogenase